MYETLEKLLKERGLTFAEVSRATGISESVFSNLKTRGNNLSFDNAAKVARFLGLPLERLAGDAED